MLDMQSESAIRKLCCYSQLRRHVLVVSICLALSGVCAECCQAAGDMPKSRLGRPLGDAPVFLVGHLALDGTFDHGAFFNGYGVSFIFRPLAAAEFMDCFYEMNTALVLQADYQKVSDNGRRILSGDIILRRYDRDMRRRAGSSSSFVGLGFGGSEIAYTRGSSIRIQKWFSWLVEGGLEWTLKSKYILVFKTQFRRYHYNYQNYTGYSFQFHAGFPLPW